MEKKLDSESNDKESGEYRGVVVTHPYPNPWLLQQASLSTGITDNT